MFPRLVKFESTDSHYFDCRDYFYPNWLTNSCKMQIPTSFWRELKICLYSTYSPKHESLYCSFYYPHERDESFFLAHKFSRTRQMNFINRFSISVLWAHDSHREDEWESPSIVDGQSMPWEPHIAIQFRGILTLVHRFKRVSSWSVFCTDSEENIYFCLEIIIRYNFAQSIIINWTWIGNHGNICFVRS